MISEYFLNFQEFHNIFSPPLPLEYHVLHLKLYFLFMIFLWGNVLFSNTEGRIALLVILIVLLAMSVRNYLLYWNLD